MIGPDEDAHGGESVRLPDVAVLGVDGWRGAWVGALLDGRSRHAARACPTSPPSSPCRTSRWSRSTCRSGCRTTAPRACDVAGPAAAWAAPAARCSPPRCARVLRRADYAEAARRPGGASGKALSVQAWNLVPGHPGARRRPGRRRRPTGCVEVHPELAFRALDDRVDATARRTARGLAQRIRALQPVMDVLDALADGARRGAGGRRARRLRRRLVGAAAGRRRRRVRGRRPTDRRGRPMRICW